MVVDCIPAVLEILPVKMGEVHFALLVVDGADGDDARRGGVLDQICKWNGGRGEKVRRKKQHKVACQSCLLSFNVPASMLLIPDCVVLPSSSLVRRNGPKWLVAKVTSSPSVVIFLGKPGGMKEIGKWKNCHPLH